MPKTSSFVSSCALPLTSLSTNTFICGNAVLSSISRFSKRSPSRSTIPSRNLPQRHGIDVYCAGSVTFPSDLDGKDYRVGLVYTRWGSEYVNSLVKDVKDELSSLGVKSDNLVEMQVPGCFELPVAVRYMASAHKVDVIVTVGVLIKGETDHYHYIAQAVSNGIMDVQLTMALPVIFGVLTCGNDQQAKERSIGDEALGRDWAKTAIEMANLRATQIGSKALGKKSVGFM